MAIVFLHLKYAIKFSIGV